MIEKENLGKTATNRFPFEMYFPPMATGEGEGRGADPQIISALHRIKERRRLIAQHLSGKEMFDSYVRAHPLRSLIERRIANAVDLHSSDIDRMGKEKEFKDLAQQPFTEQYRILAMSNCVNPTSAFPEFPGMANLRELRDLSRSYPDPGSEEHKLIVEEAIESDRYFRKQWQVLTHEQWTAAGLPPLSRLMRLIAPVPASTVWSEERYASEARMMGHAKVTNKPPPTGNGIPESAPLHIDSACNTSSQSNPQSYVPETAARLAQTTSARSKPTASPTTSSAAPATANSQTDARATTPDCSRSFLSSCDMEKIYQLAGAKALHQPIEKDDSYTFPRSRDDRQGEGCGSEKSGLAWGEDIFYDFAVMIPIPERDPPNPSTYMIPRSVVAAQLSARFAKGLLDFLTTQRLDGALGENVVSTLHTVLDVVLSTQVGTSTRQLLGLKKHLKEQAALCRSISRMRVFFIPSSSGDPTQFLEALDDAINNFPQVKPASRPVPTTSSNALHKRTLQLIDKIPNLPPEDNIEPDRRDEPGEFSPPQAINQSEGAWRHIYRNNVQQGRLTRYVQYLGGTFFDKLEELYNSASRMRDAVAQFKGDSTSPLAEFTRLAEGVINEVLTALARLFDDIAEQLALPSTLEDDGRKRLALMLVYRQYWFPEGYVAGKLVGYKNLLPNQKETLKRRTFVKTTRETTTVQEFATAREEDYSSSSKETSELVNEASSKFDFNINVHGKFDLFIVGGDIDTTTNLNFSDSSRAMHNRVAEATSKASFKYNEKREVKVRQLTEIEDVQEVVTEMQNLNREITANYFYYQLYRQYCVTTELADVRPVLLRAREVPHPAAVDEKFLANYAHVLIHALPAQLSVDLQETVGDIELLGRTLVRRRADMDQKAAAYEQFIQASKESMPTDAEGQSRWRAELDARDRAASDARAALIEAEENYIRARTRIDRVISHVRENLLYYMQFIWKASPKVDQDKLLQGEMFNGKPLDQQTLGFSRLGYYGNEEIFEYTGDSEEAVAAIIQAEILLPGSSMVKKTGGTKPLSSGSLKVGLETESLAFELTKERIKAGSAKERMKKAVSERMRRCCCKDDADVEDWILAHVFINDPASPEVRDNSRCVQVAQDALLVETMPGQVPLLEGFQMAHRMLDVQKACLENVHLSERIADRPWEREGQDSYTVLRREGEGDQLNVQVGRTEDGTKAS